MTDHSTQRPRLPELESHEARRRAESHIGLDDPQRATAYALLAIAADLAAIRKHLGKR